MLGDHHPKEVLNIIHEGKHYGWPYYYESQVLDNNFGISFDCSKTEGPAYTFTGQMAPLGLSCHQKGMLPKNVMTTAYLSRFTVHGTDLFLSAIK